MSAPDPDLRAWLNTEIERANHDAVDAERRSWDHAALGHEYRAATLRDVLARLDAARPPRPQPPTAEEHAIGMLRDALGLAKWTPPALVVRAARERLDAARPVAADTGDLVFDQDAATRLWRNGYDSGYSTGRDEVERTDMIPSIKAALFFDPTVEHPSALDRRLEPLVDRLLNDWAAQPDGSVTSAKASSKDDTP